MIFLPVPTSHKSFFARSYAVICWALLSLAFVSRAYADPDTAGSPTTVEDHFKQAKSFLIQGKFDEAIQQYDAALGRSFLNYRCIALSY